METRQKLTELVKKGNAKQLGKFLKEYSARSIQQRVNEELDTEGSTPLITCVKSAGVGFADTGTGFIECCVLLIKQGAKVNYKDTSGKTALFWAVSNRNDRLAIALLSLGADARIQTLDGVDALQAAIKAGANGSVKNISQLFPQLVNKADEDGVTPLISALQFGHEEICRHLVANGADVNVQENRSQRTTLHYALYMKKLDIFQLLLSHNAKVDLTDHRKTTVLHRSSAIRDGQYLSTIFEQCPDISPSVLNLVDCDGATAVSLACQNGNIEQLRLLIEHGASVSERDNYGRTCLHHCVEMPETDCADLVLMSDTSLLNAQDREGLTPLHMAAITGNGSLVRLLLKKGANMTCQDQEKHTVTHWATVSGQAGVLDILIEHGVDLSVPDNHKAYPLHYAAQNVNSTKPDNELGHVGVLQTLLNHHVPVDVTDQYGRQPVLWAASAGNPVACEALVAAGADVNVVDNDGLTAIHCAASRGHSACIEALVTHCHANVDPIDRNNCTPLFYAITLGHINCVNTLIQLGANTSHLDKKGRSPAHCAAVKGSQEILVLLQKENVVLWCPSENGDYPLQEAALGGHVDIVKFFLGLRSKSEVVDLANKDGRTCLHIAALTNNLSLCKLLLDSGANVNAVMQNKGKYYTPYDAANVKGHKETGEYLQSKGGQTAAVVTDNAASVIQRTVRSRKDLLRPKSPKVEIKSRQPRQAHKFEVISPEKAEPVEDEKTVIEGEGDSDEPPPQTGRSDVSVTVSLHAPRKHNVTLMTSEENAVSSKPSVKKNAVSNKPSVKSKTQPNNPKDNSGRTLVVKSVTGISKQGSEIPGYEKKKFQKSDNKTKTEPHIVAQTDPPIKGILKTSTKGIMESGLSEEQEAHQRAHLDVEVDGCTNLTGQSSNATKTGTSDSDKIQKDSPQSEIPKPDGNKTTSPRSKTTRINTKASKVLASDVQASVRRYEEERRTVRQYHQLRRAQIYTGPMFDIRLLGKLIDSGNDDVNGGNTSGKNGDSSSLHSLSQWDQYLNNQLQFLSRLEDIEPVSSIVKVHQDKLASDANVAKNNAAQHCEMMNNSAKKIEERESSENAKVDHQMEDLVARTDHLFNQIHNRASSSLQNAKEKNSELHDGMYQTKGVKLYRNNINVKRNEENNCRYRKDKYNDWNKQKAEELFRRRLLKAYKPCLPEKMKDAKAKPHSLSKTSISPFGRVRPPTNRSYNSAPSRPLSMYSKKSAYSGLSEAQLLQKNRSISIMTPYGSRKINLEDHPGASWSRRYDGGIRPRTGLMFVEPKIYEEMKKEERRQQPKVLRQEGQQIGYHDGMGETAA